MLLLAVLACADPGNHVATELPEASKAAPPRPAVADPKLPVQLPLRWPDDPMDDLAIDEAVATCVQSESSSSGSRQLVWGLAADGRPVTVTYDDGGAQRWTRGRDADGIVRLVYVHSASTTWRDPEHRTEARYDARGLLSSVESSWSHQTWAWNEAGLPMRHTTADLDGSSSYVLRWDSDGRLHGYEVVSGGSRNEVNHVWEGDTYVGYDTAGYEHAHSFRWIGFDDAGRPTYGEGVAVEHFDTESWTVEHDWMEDGRLLSTTWRGERYDNATEYMLWDGDHLVGTERDENLDGVVDEPGRFVWGYDGAGRVVSEEGRDWVRRWEWSADGALLRFERGSSADDLQEITFEGTCPAWLWDRGDFRHHAPTGRWEPPSAPGTAPDPSLR